MKVADGTIVIHGVGRVESIGFALAMPTRAEQIERVKSLFRILYREGLNRSQALERLQSHEHATSGEFQRLLAFAEKSERGLVPGV